MDHCSVLKWQFCVLASKGGKSWVMFNEAEGKNLYPWKLFVQGRTFLLVVHLPSAWNSQWLVSGKAKWGSPVMFRQSGGKSHSRLNADHNKKKPICFKGDYLHSSKRDIRRVTRLLDSTKPSLSFITRYRKGIFRWLEHKMWEHVSVARTPSILSAVWPMKWIVWLIWRSKTWDSPCWPSLNYLELLPTVYKPFFDLVISKFADITSQICFSEVKEHAWMPSITVHCHMPHRGRIWTPPRKERFVSESPTVSSP